MQKNSIWGMTQVATAAIAAGRLIGMVTGAHCAAGAKALGVSQYAAAVGEAFAVDVLGTSIIEAGAAITAGAAFKADASGKAIPQAGAGEIAGYAVTAAAGDGSKFEGLLRL